MTATQLRTLADTGGLTSETLVGAIQKTTAATDAEAKKQANTWDTLMDHWKTRFQGDHGRSSRSLSHHRGRERRKPIR